MSIAPYYTAADVPPEDIPPSGDLPEVDSPQAATSRGSAPALPLILGAEDDPDRAKVEDWVLVDNFGGYQDIYAGTACGKMFLAASGSSGAGGVAPGIPGNECSGTISAKALPGGGVALAAGFSDPGFIPCPMSQRLAVVKPGGSWRTDVSWDVLASATIPRDPAGEWRKIGDDLYLYYLCDCVTLWLVIVGNVVVFYSTNTDMQARHERARWQYSYYMANMNRGRTEWHTVDDWTAWNTMIGRDWLEADLPWFEDGESSTGDPAATAAEFGTRGGMATASRRQARTTCAAPMLVCPRYHTARLWVPSWRMGFWDMVAQDALDSLNSRFRYNPDLIEGNGIAFPTGLMDDRNGWQSPDCLPWVRVFSSTLPTAPWSNSFAIFASSCTGRLLTGSWCKTSDIEWPQAPEEGEPGDDWTEEEEDPGGGGGGDRDDRDTPNRPRGRQTLPDGYIYEGGQGITITRHKGLVGGVPGYTFDVGSTASPTASLPLIYDALLTVETFNSYGRYDWPEAGAYGLQMFYGVSGSATAVAVTWRSSYLGPDILQKSTTLSLALVTDAPGNATAQAHFEDGFTADSETPPSGYASNILTFSHIGDTTKYGTYKVLDPFLGVYRRVRFRKVYHRYRVALATGALVSIMQARLLANAPSAQGDVDRRRVEGTSDGIDGPTVDCSAPIFTARQTGGGGSTAITGPLVPRISAEYPGAAAAVSVTGSGAWNAGTRHGSIADTFTLSVRELSADDI